MPVGRRLAFDPARGRLWVVCRSCERWNLSPLEERWEALEALERRFRDTRTRVSTENVGLARLDEGLELVRVGRPKRPEFAAWRYGDQFGRRRRKYALGAVVGVGAVAGIGLGSVALLGATTLLAPLQLLSMANAARMALPLRSSTTAIPSETGHTFRLHAAEIGQQRIRIDDAHPGGWALDLAPWIRSGSMSTAGRMSVIDPDGPDPILTGPAAIHALSILMPRLNASGAGRKTVRSAASLIEEAGASERFFQAAEVHARRQGFGYSPLRALPEELRLGLEMAAHEDEERAALEGELARLEEAWKDAEALAAIADDLSLSDTLRLRFEQLRASRGRRETPPRDPVDPGPLG